MALRFQTIYDELGVQAYMIEYIKKPILEGVETLFDPTASKINKLRALNKLWNALKAADVLPRPTIENTWHPNSHNFISLRDWIKSCLKLAGIRMGFIDRIFSIVIIIYDFDPPWRWMMDSVKDEAFKMEWKQRGWEDEWAPYSWWDEKELP